MAESVIEPGSTPLVRQQIEYQPASRIVLIPANMKALFVLYSHNAESRFMNVSYVGYAKNEKGGSVRDMLQQQYELNGRLWSHFSVYELWDDFQKGDEVAVERLFLQIYRHDLNFKSHIGKNRRDETVDNIFVPKELFISFIHRLARTGTTIADLAVTDDVSTTNQPPN